MNVKFIANHFEIPDVLRAYAGSRVRLAVRRAAERVSWVAVRFLRETERSADPRVACQLDVWLRGIGLLTVRHVDVNPYVAVDCAAVRMEQALVRKLRQRGIYAGSGRRARRTVARRVGDGGRRYAVVLVPRDVRPRLSLVPWLRARYGIEQVQTISLSWREWDALVAGDVHAPHLRRFKDRLALAQLCHPEAIIVAGGAAQRPACDDAHDERPQARHEVEDVVCHIRGLGLPVDVIGVWVNEHWTADDCLIESEELPLSSPARAGRENESDHDLYAGLTSD